MKETSSPRTVRPMLRSTGLVLCITAVANGSGPESIHSIPVAPGWNPLSLPARFSNGSRAFLFPSAVSPAYVFRTPAGYVVEDTLLQPGLGYWVKVSRNGSMVLAGSAGQPCPGVPTVDYAGKTYNTVQIGSQCWLKWCFPFRLRLTTR